ncbi:MAG: VWA domain-containing protein [Oscillospiraceae bacterium]|nr:VWA domain-containing protein [Oscillospiraceae bacterium]
MGSNYKLTYNVDIVFCIDATGSMSDLIDMVKKNAVSFYYDLKEVMDAKSKVIQSLRIKVIAYRDYLEDKDDAMLRTDFFQLPAEIDAFSETVNSIHAFGGGDEPEDGLEALAFAIRSKWTTEGMKRRQIIVVWSDASTHPLGFAKTAPNYPKNMAKDFNELSRWWGDKQDEGHMNHNAKRLIMFTPDVPGWSDITKTWDNVIHFMSESGKGLEEVEYKQIIDAIVSSV